MYCTIHILGGGVTKYCDIRRLFHELFLSKSSCDKIDNAMETKFVRKGPRESSCSVFGVGDILMWQLENYCRNQLPA